MNLKGPVSRQWFARFALTVLLYNLPVILWGAYVRVSFSGDGCGANWPACNGHFLPGKMTAPMAIEFTHRAMTSIDTVAVIAMLIWAFLVYPKKHAIRRYAVWSLVFLFIEALLGAGLVLFRLVAKDQSAGRVWYLSAHLTNTMLLLAVLTLTAWLARVDRDTLRLTAFPRRLWLALVLVVFVSITGAITALGDTLFPAASLASGMQQDFSSAVVLLRLRIIHPVIALCAALYLVWIANRERRIRAANWVIIAAVVQVGAGVLNLSLLAPLAMQLTHLLLADLLWIVLVVLAAETAVATHTADRPSISRAPAETSVRLR